MSEKSIAIIGAGVAGLAAGCYGRMNGYRTRIFEMHTRPGGLCTCRDKRFNPLLTRPGLAGIRIVDVPITP